MAETNGLQHVLLKHKKLLVLFIILMLVIGFVLWLADRQMNEINQLMPEIGSSITLSLLHKHHA